MLSITSIPCDCCGKINTLYDMQRRKTDDKELTVVDLCNICVLAIFGA